MKKTFIVAGVFVILDYISKLLVNMFLTLNDSIVIINNFFSFTYVHNEGAAFSMFGNSNYVLAFIGIFFVILILYYLSKKSNIGRLESVCYGLLLGGACGNLIDRIVYGYVVDFLDFKIFGYDFPVFNVADSFIVISAFIIVVLEFRNDKLVIKKKI